MPQLLVSGARRQRDVHARGHHLDENVTSTGSGQGTFLDRELGEASEDGVAVCRILSRDVGVVVVGAGAVSVGSWHGERCWYWQMDDAGKRCDRSSMPSLLNGSSENAPPELSGDEVHGGGTCDRPDVIASVR